MKKAILIISFGTSYHETRAKTIDACERRLAESCPDRDAFRAFTSEMIIRKLAKRDGMQIDNPNQALQRLAEQGYQDVVIQSLHIINGDEYEKVVTQVRAHAGMFKRLRIGVPLLSSHDDFEQLIAAMKSQMPALADDERVVFMGHGATHHAFAAYACLDHMLMNHQIPAMVGAVESYPEIHHVVTRLQQQNVRRVHLMPLMLVAGDHAINDMASDDEDSWKTQLAQAGIEATPWLQGLGENPLIQQMFVEHLHDVLHQAEEAA
ncbi:MAG: sirohydrochlorin cobaltochelatase [Hafnia alvei]|uniref:sirohydrochlorin cobaltochelatase n=1 Tax=Hafnia alvei TaxID=569 RepID=UPI001412941F|nr:sirohydrochlorin cobaltochelatase [Hafnia alvei]MDU7483112.1 sirohydrochlorin cobaltochelatase [Hafnia alvei]QIP54928.1 sirohydrochlorin cobaltochelatase [Hafnia alvei]WNN53336.1 sirohydrochlorin cobaltochelatase [Hafnia alvei]